MTATGTWTIAREQQLTEMWEQGLTCSVIATELKVTPNSVIGKVHRMKLAARVERLSQEELDRRREQRRSADNARREYRSHNTRYAAMIGRLEKPMPKEAPQKNKPRDVPMFAGSLNILFNDLRFFSEIAANQCRYIEGDTPPYAVCGNVTPDGQSYCRHHRSIVYNGSREAPRLSEAERNRRAVQAFKNSRRHTAAPSALRCITDGADELLGASSSI